MKQILYIILLALFPAMTAWGAVGDTFTANNLKYKVTSESPKTVQLTGYVSKPTGTLEIPATVNDYSVTSIGTNAFRSCSGLKSVVLPDGLTSIGNGAFGYCYNMTSANIPDGVTSIGNNAFFDCEALKEITIPSSVTSIGYDAFCCCIDLKSVTINDGVTSLGYEAFLGCESLTEVSIPASVTSIGKSAFESCTSLKTVNIYATSLTTYGKDAFMDTPAGLEINVFGDNVTAFTKGWTDYSSKISAFNAEDLTVEGISANQNPSLTSDNWATYYHPAANTKIKTSDVEIYIATLGTNNAYVNLTKVEGNNIIKAGQAVMLKAADAGALSLELTPDAATGDYTGNDLKGGTAVASGKVAYTLAAMNDRMGFYKFAGSALNPGKAHLELPTSASIRELIALDEEEATSLSEELRVKSEEFDDAWYDLNGRRIANGQKPTAKGVFLHNGRKEVVR